MNYVYIFTRYIGGASVSTPQPLPDDLGEWMGNATDGVVLVTFGSFKIARAVVHQIQKKLFSAFSKIKQRVILQVLNFYWCQFIEN